MLQVEGHCCFGLSTRAPHTWVGARIGMSRCTQRPRCTLQLCYTRRLLDYREKGTLILTSVLEDQVYVLFYWVVPKTHFDIFLLLTVLGGCLENARRCQFLQITCSVAQLEQSARFLLKTNSQARERERERAFKLLKGCQKVVRCSCADSLIVLLWTSPDHERIQTRPCRNQRPYQMACSFWVSGFQVVE